ncbi:hypothetical protein JCM12178A_24910 [Salidesulfovibrio brasiliensis]
MGAFTVVQQGKSQFLESLSVTERYTRILPNMLASTFLEIVGGQVKPDSIVYTDSLPMYKALDVAGFRHHRINHKVQFVEEGYNHINGIENFWNQAKRHLRKHNGIAKKHFLLYLKECESRFNYGSPKEQLTTLKDWIKRDNKA